MTRAPPIALLSAALLVAAAPPSGHFAVRSLRPPRRLSPAGQCVAPPRETGYCPGAAVPGCGGDGAAYHNPCFAAAPKKHRGPALTPKPRRGGGKSGGLILSGRRLGFDPPKSKKTT
eukprot:Selendium_serpulae@DN9716_c0_g1_i1.p3